MDDKLYSLAKLYLEMTDAKYVVKGKDRKGNSFSYIFDSQGDANSKAREIKANGGTVEFSGKNTATESNDPCWKGYRQYGMKDKGGKKVPNCVPKESDNPLFKAHQEAGEYILKMQRAVGDPAFYQEKNINPPRAEFDVRQANWTVDKSRAKKFASKDEASAYVKRFYFRNSVDLYDLKSNSVVGNLHPSGEITKESVEAPKRLRDARPNYITLEAYNKHLSGEGLSSALAASLQSEWYSLIAQFTARPETFDVHQEQEQNGFKIFKMTPGQDVKEKAYESIQRAASTMASKLNGLLGKDVFEPRIQRVEGNLECLVAFKDSRGGVFQCKATDNGGDSTIFLTIPNESELKTAFNSMLGVQSVEPETGIDQEFDDQPVAGEPAPEPEPEVGAEFDGPEAEADLDDPLVDDQPVSLDDPLEDEEDDVDLNRRAFESVQEGAKARKTPFRRHRKESVLSDLINASSPTVVFSTKEGLDRSSRLRLKKVMGVFEYSLKSTQRVNNENMFIFARKESGSKDYDGLNKRACEAFLGGFLGQDEDLNEYTESESNFSAFSLRGQMADKLMSMVGAAKKVKEAMAKHKPVENLDEEEGEKLDYDTFRGKGQHKWRCTYFLKGRQDHLKRNISVLTKENDPEAAKRVVKHRHPNAYNIECKYEGINEDGAAVSVGAANAAGQATAHAPDAVHQNRKFFRRKMNESEDDGTIQVGSWVKLSNDPEWKKITDGGAHGAMHFSIGSPLGKAIEGLKAGDTSRVIEAGRKPWKTVDILDVDNSELDMYWGGDAEGQHDPTSKHSPKD